MHRELARAPGYKREISWVQARQRRDPLRWKPPSSPPAPEEGGSSLPMPGTQDRSPSGVGLRERIGYRGRLTLAHEVPGDPERAAAWLRERLRGFEAAVG